MTTVSHGFNSYLSSAELNQRFADFAGGSILSGFRLSVGSVPGKVSLLRQGELPQVALTNNGIRIVEERDLVDILEVRENYEIGDRVDVLYLNYLHGDGDGRVSYTIVEGRNGEEPPVYWTSTTRTPLGFIRVRQNEELAASDLTSLPTGLTIHELVFRQALQLPNGLQAGDVAVKRLTINGVDAADQTLVEQRYVEGKAYADQKVADLVDGSPGLLDTLNEIAQALGDDPEFATTMTNELAKKINVTRFEAHETDDERHLLGGEREAWHAKETPEAAQEKANLARVAAVNQATLMHDELLGEAPEDLNNLKKIAEAIGNDPQFAVHTLESISTKLSKTQFEAHVADVVTHLLPGEKAIWYAKETPEGAQAKANQAKSDVLVQIYQQYDQPLGRAGLATDGRLRPEQLTVHNHDIEEVSGLSEALAEKSATDHTHDLANSLNNGLLSKEGYKKLRDIAENANNYVHPDIDGSLHVPATGTTNEGKVLMAGLAAGEISWKSILFSDVGSKPTTLEGYGISDALSVYGGSLLGTLVIEGNSGTPLSLRGGDADHAYVQFYARKDDIGTRSAYFGIPGPGMIDFHVVNEMLDGNVVFGTSGTGKAYVNEHEIMTTQQLGDITNLETIENETVVDAVNELNIHANNLNLHMRPSERVQFNKIRFDEFDPLSVTASNRNATANVYTTVEYKRPNGTLYLRSTTSDLNATNQYQRITLEYFNASGTTATETQIWNIVYDTQGGIVSKTKG